MLTPPLIAIVLAVGSPHSVQVDHVAGPLSVTYRPAVQLMLKQVGMAVPTRADTTRCRWFAKVEVDRTVQRHRGSLRHAVGTPGWLSGSRPGDCAAARTAIEREVAARTDEIDGQVRRVAAADRQALMADVDAAVGLASAN